MNARYALRTLAFAGGSTLAIYATNKHFAADQKQASNYNQKQLPLISSRMEALVKKWQDDLTTSIEEIEAKNPNGKKFFKDVWKRAYEG